MTKRLILAMGLWFVLLLIMMQVFKSEDVAPVAATNQAAKTNAAGAQQAKAATDPKQAAVLPVVRASEIVSNRVAKISTENFEISLNRIDGSVDSLKLLKYLEEGKPIEFVEKNIKNYANFRIGFDIFATNEPAEAAWEYRKESDLVHVFSREIREGLGKGLFVEKKYRFDPKAHHFDIDVRIVNRALEKKEMPRDGIMYSLIWGSPVDWLADKSKRSTYDMVAVAAYHQGEDSIERISENKKTTDFRWIGFEDRYFLFSIIPLGKDGGNNQFVRSANVTGADASGSAARMLAVNRGELKIGIGEESVDTYRIFFRPKRYSLLSSKEYASYKIDTILDGFVLTKWLGIAFEQLIFLFYGVISNFGIVIILVTILVKILLHPLTNKSFVSMRKMQLIQPKLAALKEQFKGDPKRLNEEMMKMYKKEGVNPMGGCLPMLLQLPIFIALYQVLPRLADLKNVSFLWINDLSSPDTVTTIEAFRDIPLLPYNLNILPIIMTVFSVWQTRLTTPGSAAGQDQMQKQQSKMMMLMPIMFLFLFWNMPSGLVLYWTVQTVVSIGQQVYINRKYSAVPVATK